MLCGEHIDDEFTVIDPLLVCGLRCGHEVGLDLGTAFGSSAADDLAHYHQCSCGQLAVVVVRRDVGIAHELQQPVELRCTTPPKRPSSRHFSEGPGTRHAEIKVD